MGGAWNRKRIEKVKMAGESKANNTFQEMDKKTTVLCEHGQVKFNMKNNNNNIAIATVPKAEVCMYMLSPKSPRGASNPHFQSPSHVTTTPCLSAADEILKDKEESRKGCCHSRV